MLSTAQWLFGQRCTCIVAIIIVPWHAYAARDTLVVWSALRLFCRSVGLLGGSVTVHSA